ncbi:MAG TPA: NADH:flavin oxidoreductase/NADH oxidase [Candidatus Nitrosotalea sp.]|nr:NADH:flavin oxidoreductase/NADH oxidase [Candidatus Nitrosotalea sp.]
MATGALGLDRSVGPPHLFEPLRLRSIELRNRIAVSPMCQYSSQDGFANDWHLVHLGSRAVGGAGLVLAEATAVTPQGRISPADLGLWKDEQVDYLARIAAFVRAHGAAPGIQLGHAGRKASTAPPFAGGGTLTPEGGGWRVCAPSAIAFEPGGAVPEELDEAQIAAVIDAFEAAAARALAAGFEVVELHGAHGYLLHQFLSPLSNHRNDRWGGSFENRIRLVVAVVSAVRRRWPDSHPLLLRLSATDWVDGGWDLEQTVELARHLAGDGVDLIDCSSGGLVPVAAIPIGPGYQVRFAQRVREAGVATGAVGMITSAEQADQIVRSGQADLVLLARQMLRDPYWPLHAGSRLAQDASWPDQYLRARRRT